MQPGKLESFKYRTHQWWDCEIQQTFQGCANQHISTTREIQVYFESMGCNCFLWVYLHLLKQWDISGNEIRMYDQSQIYEFQKSDNVICLRIQFVRQGYRDDFCEKLLTAVLCTIKPMPAGCETDLCWPQPSQSSTVVTLLWGLDEALSPQRYADVYIDFWKPGIN